MYTPYVQTSSSLWDVATKESKQVSNKYQTSIKQVSKDYQMSIKTSMKRVSNKYETSIKQVWNEYQTSMKRVSNKYETSIKMSLKMSIKATTISWLVYTCSVFGAVMGSVFYFFQVDPTSNLSFNLKLSEVDRNARAKLSLPYMFHDKPSNAAQANIFYQPDDADDFDEDDPDNDLDI